MTALTFSTKRLPRNDKTTKDKTNGSWENELAISTAKAPNGGYTNHQFFSEPLQFNFLLRFGVSGGVVVSPAFPLLFQLLG